MSVSKALARAAWDVCEPIHDIAYFAPEIRQSNEALGLGGHWLSYFGTRAAPLGAVPASVVVATFYNFAPRRVHSAVPQVWQHAGPDKVLSARNSSVERALRRILGEDATGPQVRRAAALGVAAAAAVVDAGARPLGAANAALPTPDEPHVALWQAMTTLREHRGDGHIAALVGGEVGPCEALVLAAATGRGSRELLQRSRKWTDDEWAAAVESLTGRGWLGAEATLTEAGRAARQAIEDQTDQLSVAPYDMLGEARTNELIGLLTPIAERVVAASPMPLPRTASAPWPASPAATQ